MRAQVAQFGQLATQLFRLGLQGGGDLGQDHARPCHAHRPRRVQQQQRPWIGINLRQHAQQLREPPAFRLEPQGQLGLAQPRLPQCLAQRGKARLVGADRGGQGGDAVFGGGGIIQCGDGRLQVG
jgi:hypothetical protein